MERMVEAAIDAGLGGIGFADHCLVSDPEKEEAFDYPMDVDDIGERRAEIEDLDRRYDVDVFDAVEVDYYPDDEANPGSS